jgi:hypothetical protein
MAWDTEWAAEKAAAAMRYLADFYPEGLRLRGPPPPTGRRTRRRGGGG